MPIAVLASALCTPSGTRMEHPDYAGIAQIIASLGTLLAAIMSALVFIRQGREIVATKALHDSVNGQSEALKALIGKEAFGAGEKAGMEAERARPAEGKPA